MKFLFAMRTLATLTLMFLPTFVLGQQSVNLVSNYGFEYATGSTPAHWVLHVPENASHASGPDDEQAHSGQRSFRISRIWAYPRRPLRLETREPIAIVSQKKYLLSFWYRTIGMTEYALPFSAAFRVACATGPAVEYAKLIPKSGHWQQYHVLLDLLPRDAEALTISFRTAVNTKGGLWLDDVAFCEASEADVTEFEHWRRLTRNEIRPVGDGAQRFRATGYYRVEKGTDRWWLVDPAGVPTWAMAIAGSSAMTVREDRGATEKSHVSQAVVASPTDADRKLYSFFADECGFNAFAGWTADLHAEISRERVASGQPSLPMTKVLGLMSAARGADVYVKDRHGNAIAGGHPMADPFNPHWREMARERAERTIAPYREQPWFLGWYVDNEIDFAELHRFVWAEYSGAEFVRTLKKKYGTIDALNQAWSGVSRWSAYGSFADILAERPEARGWDDPAWPDFAAFERQMIGEYISFTSRLVRELDPNHLVMSNRINLNPMPELYRTIDLWGQYDIVCMNIYPDNNRIGFNTGELELMCWLHEGTGRPVMIGEWSVPAVDSGLYELGDDPQGRPLDWSWIQVLHTQKERGEAYETCMWQLASLDFMVGAGWFITYDVDSPTRRANRGILDRHHQPYRDLTDAMKRTHIGIKREMKLAW